MPDSDKTVRICEILDELELLNTKDAQLIRHRPLDSREPLVAVPVAELFAYSERYESRQALHEELRKLAG